MKSRARDLGLDFPGTPGFNNAITDIDGVCVGYTTHIEERVRSGVTAILPRGFDKEPSPVWAGIYALNGNGEMTGSHWVRDGGYFVGPMCITNTHSVGIVHHAATRWTINHYAEQWQDEHLWAMPVVAETYDGVLNDINGQHITEQDALDAINSAETGPIAEGNVGGGTGMIAYEFKGGTGTSSRRIEIDGQTYTLGTLVQANHGIRPWLTILGAPVGQHMTGDRLLKGKERGSIIVAIGTDAPLLPHQLERLARRAAIGIGRGGTPGGNDSGDIFLAFSTANKQAMPQLSAAKLSMDCINDCVLDELYLAAVESTDESVVNAMVAADDMTTLKPEGQVCRAIDHEQLIELVKAYGRCT